MRGRAVVLEVGELETIILTDRGEIRRTPLSEKGLTPGQEIWLKHSRKGSHRRAAGSVA